MLRISLTYLPLYPIDPIGGETVSKKFEPRTINIFADTNPLSNEIIIKIIVHPHSPISHGRIHLHAKNPPRNPLPNSLPTSVLPSPFSPLPSNQISRGSVCRFITDRDSKFHPSSVTSSFERVDGRGSGITDVSNDAERRKPSGACLLQAWGVATGGRVVSEPSELW